MFPHSTPHRHFPNHTLKGLSTMDSTTVVAELEPALAAVTIEALAAELRLTRNMLADANDEIDRLNTALEARLAVGERPEPGDGQ